jgi:PAS domain S-box-containing protein
MSTAERPDLLDGRARIPFAGTPAPRPSLSGQAASYRKLRWILICTYASIASVSIGLGLLYLKSERTKLLEESEVRTAMWARVLAEHVVRTFAAVDGTLQEIGNRVATSGALTRPASPGLVAELAAAAKDSGVLRSIYLFDAGGKGHASALGADITRLDARDFAHVSQAFVDDSGRLIIGRLVSGPVTGKPTIAATRRIAGANGRTAGVIGAAIEPAYFEELYKELKTGSDITIALLRTNGTILVRVPDIGKYPADVSRSEYFRGPIGNLPSGTVEITSVFDGARRILSFRRIPEFGLIVATARDVDAALAPWRWQAGYVLALIALALASGLAALAVALRLIRRQAVTEMRHELAVGATLDGICDWDVETGESYVSPRFREILGYGKDSPELDSRAQLEALIHPDERERVRSCVERAARDGTPYRLEYRVRHKDGGYRWILSRGEPTLGPGGRMTRMVGAISDVTEQKDAERSISEQARLLRLIFRHTLDCIVLLDRNYNFIRVSDSYAGVCRRPAAELVGRNHFELYPSDLEEELESFRKDKRIYSRQSRPFVFPDHPEWGTTYWDLAVVPILDSAGEIELFLFTLKDVTEPNRAAQECAHHSRQLRALSSRMLTVQEDERRRLARELHDEIGQGLTAAKIRLQAIELSCLGSQRPIAFDKLQEAASSVAEALEQVRSLSGALRPLHLEDLGLVTALESLLKRSASAAGWVTHFEDDLGAERLGAEVELACYRVAQEALTNCMRHAAASFVRLGLRRTDSVLELTVRDDGRGFDREALRSGGEGSGLGLLGMQERVCALGGAFEVSASAPGGTEIRARFPLPAREPGSGT